MEQIITGPKCPFCGNDINSVTIGYKFEDVSLSHGDLRFIDIFFCRKCGAVLNITKSIK